METILEVKDLKKTFYKDKVPFTAVNNISFSVGKGECIGLVGESGCGKSTTAKIITRLLDADDGSIFFDGDDILKMKNRELKGLYKKVQMVFQNPQGSFDPRRTLGDGIMESLINMGQKKVQAKEEMLKLLKMVGLDSDFAKRYPHEVSGGQCQRAAIARAIAVKPELIICDEATSALDVTVQMQIVSLLKQLQKDTGVSLFLISHDLALVQHMCDRVLVMCKGKIVEQGITDEVIMHPKTDYTRILIDSVF